MPDKHYRFKMRSIYGNQSIKISFDGHPSAPGRNRLHRQQPSRNLKQGPRTGLSAVLPETGQDAPAYENPFSPAMPTRIMARNSSLGRETVSPNRKTPAMKAPAVPIPVQTAYAVPTGKVFMA